MKSTVLSTADVAGLLKVNESTVKRWTDKGTLRCFKTPGGHRKYHRADVAEFIGTYGFEAVLPGLEPGVPPSGIPVSTDYAILTKNNAALAVMLRDTILRGDQDDTYHFLRLLSANRYTLVELYDHIVTEALRLVGSMWVDHTVSIEQEHIATNCMLAALRSLQNDIPKKRRTNRIALCGCFEGEFHEVGITCVRNVLDAEGWTTFYIGPNLPVDSFIAAIERFSPDVVCVSATTPKSKFQFRRNCASLLAATHAAKAKLMIGGLATLHAGKNRIPADYIPGTITETLRWVETEFRPRQA
jgi:excisionase family DNA binding protein